jgi:hypothetical protein
MSWKIKKNLEVKNWKETAKDRRIWTDLAEKAKTHRGFSVCSSVHHHTFN